MTVYNDELCHWGIKGMKWGVRRYQNPDGTLTSAGKKRYSSDDYKNGIKKAGNVAEKLERYSTKARSNNPKKMTDEELNRRISRMQKEKQYLELKKSTSPGKAYVTELLKTAGNKIVGGAAGVIGGVAGKVAVDAVLNHYGDIAVAAVNATGSDTLKKAVETAAMASAVKKS